MKKDILIVLILAIIISVLVLRLMIGFIPLPIGIRHFINMLVAPKESYAPIIVDKFLFHERGFTKTYILNPKHLDIYEVGVLFEKGGIESTYKYKGKIKFEFYWKDTFLFDGIVTTFDSALYEQNDMSKYRQISLFKFDVPLQRKYIEDISLKLTVLEPDQILERYKDLSNLYIAVSSVP
jgi:hypothetical protein